MGQQSGREKEPAEQVIKQIRRAPRRQFSAEEKIRIVLSGLRGEDSIAELCRREGIVQNLYYRWSKEFLEARKKRLAGDTARSPSGLDDETEAEQLLSPCNRSLGKGERYYQQIAINRPAEAVIKGDRHLFSRWRPAPAKRSLQFQIC